MIPGFSFIAAKPASEPGATAPPPIPWDSLFVSRSNESANLEATTKSEMRSLTDLHDALLESIEQPSARQLLTAMVFLVTRKD